MTKNRIVLLTGFVAVFLLSACTCGDDSSPGMPRRYYTTDTSLLDSLSVDSTGNYTDTIY
jgi:hypothetical protein